jgi:diadenosine tetraphosphate (Ap4A) HIT family hydrolase
MHLIPRYKDTADAGMLSWGHLTLSDEEMQEIKKRLI